MTALIAIALAVVVAIVIAATKAAGTKASAREVSTDPEGPAPRPPRPHIRGPPGPALATCRTTKPRPGEQSHPPTTPPYRPTTKSLTTLQPLAVRPPHPENPAHRHTDDVKHTRTKTINDSPCHFTTERPRRQPPQLSAISRNDRPESTGTAVRNHRNAQ